MIKFDIQQFKQWLAHHPHGKRLLEGPQMIDLHDLHALMLDFTDVMEREHAHLERQTAAARISLQPDWATAHEEAVARQRLAREKVRHMAIREGAGQ